MARLRNESRTNKGNAGAEHLIFISHATTDKWIARVICDKLEAVGAKTFRDDRDIAGGDLIPEEIRKQIYRSHELLVLLTPNSVGRMWVNFELAVGWGRGKRMRIVVVLYHVDVEAIPEPVRSRKAILLNDFDQYLKEMAERLRAKHDE